MEERLTALLLDELSATEAAEVRAALDQDPALAELHAHLAVTIDLVREATAHPAQPGTPPEAAPKLSQERRDQLLGTFQTIAAPKFRRAERTRDWLIPMGIAALLMILVGLAALWPGWSMPSEKKVTRLSRSLRDEEPTTLSSQATPLQDGKEILDLAKKSVVAPASPSDAAADPMTSRDGESFHFKVKAMDQGETTERFGLFTPEIEQRSEREQVSDSSNRRGRLAVEAGEGGSVGGGAGLLNQWHWSDPQTTARSPEVAEDKAAGRKDDRLANAETKERVPLLGDRPALGRLLRGEQDVADLKPDLPTGPPDAVLALGKSVVRTPLETNLPLPAIALDFDSNSARHPFVGLEEARAGFGTIQVAAEKPAERELTRARIPVIADPEVATSENPYSTFSLNVSDVSFRLAAAALDKGLLPEPSSVRAEEFLNAFDYRDPQPRSGSAVGFSWERAPSPFHHHRDLLRLSIRTASQGRPAGQAFNLVLLLDRSGSMERADRVRIMREALRVLAGQLQAGDKLSLITFARTARLWVDGVNGSEAAQVLEQAATVTPEGGTNLEDALNLAYATGQKHFLSTGINRVVLFTDGAANLGEVYPEALKRKVDAARQKGIALDCFGVGWEGLDDDLLQVLSSHGDGRYGFINTPEEAAAGFASQLAGALQIAAADVKVQVEFNPKRVTSYRQVGYNRFQLSKDQFRDNKVDAAEIGSAESGNALYVIESNTAGNGPIGVVRVHYKVPATGEIQEREWTVPYAGAAADLESSSPAMRLAGSAAAFAEWLGSNPYAGDVQPERLLKLMAGVSDAFGTDPRPGKLERMIRQAQSLNR